MQSNIQIINRDDTCFVDIEGTIGTSKATYEHFKKTLEKLRTMDVPRVVVNIRSTGGDVNDALLIHDALRSLDIPITTRCYGYTASAATVIAQAASEGCREISAQALYLIHNSICAAEGNVEELASKTELLRKTDTRLAELYAARSGRPAAEFSALMAENSGNGRWLSPEEAMAAGLVDRIVLPVETTKERKALGNPFKKIFGRKAIEVPAPGATPAPPPAPSIFHFDAPEQPDEIVRRTELVLHEGQRLIQATRTNPCEDPSLSDQLLSANERAYAEDAKRLFTDPFI